MNAKEKIYVDSGRDFGIADVYSFPIHGFRGDFGLLRFVNYRLKSEIIRTFKELNELAFLSNYIYETIVKVLQQEEESNSHMKLTNREKEVLQWTAMGKRPEWVGDKMNIANNTVRRHLSNIRTKLGVRSSTHAVAKSISTKLITI